MKAAIGFKAHSGWAAMVAVATSDSGPCVIDRRRTELVEQGNAAWARQPYHAADRLDRNEARKLVARGIDSARRLALRELRAAVARARQGGHEVGACAVLMGAPMPSWTVDEILAVHFRMHMAEGVLFRDALARAADACGLEVVAIPEKTLIPRAEKALGETEERLRKTIAAIGRSVGPPWGRDQKEASLAALVALLGRPKPGARGRRDPS